MPAIGSPQLSMPVTSSTSLQRNKQTRNSSCCAQMKPEMTVTAVCRYISIYVMLHKLGMFGSPGLQSLSNIF